MSDTDITGPQVLSWVSVLPEVAGDLNFFFFLSLVRMKGCETKKSMPEAPCAGKSLG